MLKNNDKYFLYYKNQKTLLKIINYKNNTFNLSKNNSLKPSPPIITNPTIPIPIPPYPPVPLPGPPHAKGLENIGATCYMNATL